MMSGLGKKLIAEYEFNAKRLVELWDLYSSCEHSDDTDMGEHYKDEDMHYHHETRKFYRTERCCLKEFLKLMRQKSI